jgi:hypothetical protein
MIRRILIAIALGIVVFTQAALAQPSLPSTITGIGPSSTRYVDPASDPRCGPGKP